MASNQVTTESLNEVVIRLLALNDGDELSYQTYFERIKKKLFTARLGNKELPQEEDELLRNELKRVKKIKDQGLRFKVKKVKVNNRTTTVPPSSTPSTSPQYNNKKTSTAIVKRKDAIIKSKGGEIAPYEGIKPKEKEEDKKEQKGFSNIRRTLDSILSILASKFKFEQKESDKQRREEEAEKRGKRESSLEGFKKGIGAIVSLTKKMLSPFDAVIERIKRFIFFTLLGRAFNMFMKWMENKENRKKFDSLIEFLADHWPAIAGLYILFGTSFGKLVRGLLKTAARMTVAFLTSIPKIVAFIKKNKKLSRLILTGLAATPFISKQIGEIFNPKESEDVKISDDGTKELEDARSTIERTKDINAPGVNTGGLIPTTTGQQKPADTKLLASNSGGIVPKFNLGGLIPQFAMGGINPFGGFDFQQGVPITGAGKDDTLIAAKTGEAVLTEKDQQDLSSRYVDRETGQPLNIPEYLSDRKSSFVNLSNLKVAGGYYNGGIVGGGTNIIPKFNTGGVVGGSRRGIRDILGRGVGDWERGTTTLDALRRRIPSDLARPKGNTSGVPTVPLSQSSYFGRILSGLNQSGKGSADNPNYTGPITGAGSGTRDKMPGTTPSNKPLYNQDKNSQITTPLKRGNILKLQKGGLVENATNFIQGLFGFGKKPTPPSKPKTKGPLPEFMNPEILALLKTIRAAEHYKGSDPYTSIYGGGNAPITKMTIQEVIDMGNTGRLPKRFGGKSAGYGSGSAATGAYQFMPFTLQDLIRRGLAKPSEMFSSSVQDRLGWELAKGRGVNLGSLRKTGLNQSIMDMMAPEWASFPYSGAGGKSFYGQPVKSPDFLREIFGQSLRSFKGPKKKAGGSIGEVGESEGTNIPGATADRQLFPITSGGFAALQPGEFVMPRKAVQERGLDFMNKLASADSASEAYLMRGKVNGPNITPYGNLGSSGMEGMVTLPPIVAGGTGMNRPRASGLAGGSGVPSFPYRHPNGNHNMHAQIYGIGSMVG
jgi:muramidase (phage lysozyme)